MEKILLAVSLRANFALADEKMRDKLTSCCQSDAELYALEHIAFSTCRKVSVFHYAKLL